jgi:hypothetical protein
VPDSSKLSFDIHNFDATIDSIDRDTQGYKIPILASHFQPIPGKATKSTKLLLVALRELHGDLARIHRVISMMD